LLALVIVNLIIKITLDESKKKFFKNLNGQNE